MNYLLYIAILPVVLLLAYIYKKDTHKEPGNVLAKIFFFGVLTVIPAIILEIILAPFFPTENCKSIAALFISVFIGIALVEETVKWLVIKLIIYKSKHFDETFDGIVYAVFASLGFACIENVLYVLLSGAGTGVVRAITAVPLHACTGITMGYFIGKAKLCARNNDSSKEIANVTLSLLVPTTIHTIYDFLVFTQKMEFIIIWVVFILIIYIVCFMLVKKSTRLNETTNSVPVTQAIPQEENKQVMENKTQNDQNVETSKGLFCRYCGKKIDESNYCPYCGKKNN